jgi:hypothetical protein
MHPTIQFLVKDIIHPRPDEVLCELYSKSRVQGEVVAVTDDGREPVMLVKVRGLSELVLVPTRKASSLPPAYERSRDSARTCLGERTAAEG